MTLPRITKQALPNAVRMGISFYSDEPVKACVKGHAELYELRAEKGRLEFWYSLDHREQPAHFSEFTAERRKAFKSLFEHRFLIDTSKASDWPDGCRSRDAWKKSGFTVEVLYSLLLASGVGDADE